MVQCQYNSDGFSSVPFGNTCHDDALDVSTSGTSSRNGMFLSICRLQRWEPYYLIDWYCLVWNFKNKWVKFVVLATT